MLIYFKLHSKSCDYLYLLSTFLTRSDSEDYMKGQGTLCDAYMHAIECNPGRISLIPVKVLKDLVDYYIQVV